MHLNDMTLQNSIFLLGVALGSLVFSGCYAHSKHYTGHGYHKHKPVYGKKVYVKKPSYYHGKKYRGYKKHYH